MAIPYETLLPQILPMVSGCSDSLIINSIRSAVIELCEYSEVYQLELDPISTSSDVYEYDLDTPTGATVHKVLWVTHDGKDLEPITTTLLEQRLPNWRKENGVPEYFVKQSPSTFLLAPIPTVFDGNSTIVRAALKPTHTSVACDNDVMNDYRDTIVNGALFRLLRIPNKDWSDLTGAQVYGNLFNQGVMAAERRARNADTAVHRSVKYGGLRSGAYKTRRKRYGR